MQDPSPFGQQPSLSFPEHEQLKCPRCDSANTKFCYYNNYNLSQPRHFCKSCRRYWTKGGTLRSIPVGGGTRKRPKRPNPQPDPNPDPRPKLDHHPDPNTPGSGGTGNQETELRGDAGLDCFFRPGSRFQ